jgi:hypothetical protein
MGAFTLFLLIVNVCSAIIGIAGTSEMGKLSIGRTIGALLLGGVLLLIPYAIMVAFFVSSSSVTGR